MIMHLDSSYVKGIIILKYGGRGYPYSPSMIL